MIVTRVTPAKCLIAGLVALPAFIWGTIEFYSSHPNGYSKAELAFYTSSITRWDEITDDKNSRTLRLWIENEPLPFLSDSNLYPDSYDKFALQYLGRGASVTIGVPLEQRDKPRRVWLKDERFRLIVYLRIHTGVALNLETYNQWARKNAQLGLVVFPLLILASVGSIILGIRFRGGDFPG